MKKQLAAFRKFFAPADEFKPPVKKPVFKRDPEFSFTDLAAWTVVDVNEDSATLSLSRLKEGMLAEMRQGLDRNIEQMMLYGSAAMSISLDEAVPKPKPKGQLAPRDIRIILNTITYKPGWTVTYEEQDAWTIYGSLHFKMQAPDANSKHGEILPVFARYKIEDQHLKSTNAFLAFIKECLLSTETHELHEFFRIEGKPYQDPHAHDYDIGGQRPADPTDHSGLIERNKHRHSHDSHFVLNPFLKEEQRSPRKYEPYTYVPYFPPMKLDKWENLAPLWPMTDLKVKRILGDF